MAKIGFIGSGNMAQALIKAILDKGISKDIISSDVDEKKLDDIKNRLKINTTKDNKEVVEKSDIIFIAVKPGDIGRILDEIKISIDNKIIVSIAAGIKISYIESKIGDKKIARVMPNTPCLVGEMAAAFSPKNLTNDEILTIESILSSAGRVFMLEEELLDAVTGLSGSGPAFVARLIQAFTEAGMENGLDKNVAYELSLKTFEGTAKLLAEKGMMPEELIKIVSSPNGTTVAGREILDNSDIKEIIKKTIKKAAERSKELGK
ncbi:MAG: pyrroline-5-carboxylate reductase [Nanoarchaeota archaeon]|nr:pyrroline-5-carboxylate reductase [Nanoarchaeota archaeon]